MSRFARHATVPVLWAFNAPRGGELSYVSLLILFVPTPTTIRVRATYL